jgi:hypothetical protein
VSVATDASVWCREANGTGQLGTEHTAAPAAVPHVVSRLR